MRYVTVRQLQVFVEAAESMSFARAAEKLHLSAAGVSFQIKQIEAQSGFALFERAGKAQTLTEAGRSLIIYAKRVLQSLQDADQAMMALKGVTGGRVTIGLVSTAKYLVPHMLARFKTIYPGIVIHLRDGNRRDINAALAKGEIDLAVMGQPLPNPEIVAEAFAEHPTVIAAATTHRLAGRAHVRLEELMGEYFITREEGAGTRSQFDQLFRDVAFNPRVTMTSSSNETIKQAVMAGMGVALISRHTVGLELHLGIISILQVDGFPLIRSWYVAHRRNMPLLPVHERLRRFLLEEGQSIIDEIDEGYRAIVAGLAAEPAEAIGVR
jgi:DNA-binding transcriptional LysR family regulator